MSTIDDRIVSMHFDNQQFENGVKQSVDSLGKLKNGLKLSESAKSLSNLSAEGKRFNLGGMADAIKGISDKFSSMGIIGITILSNLTNQAFNAGKRILSSLTIDPIKAGLQEYETQLNAVQTILANTSSKGTNITDVSKALDELNTYADKTIYNFTEMARNIGTFTAAGVDLDVSVAAIKGIANLAAVSGSNSQQASTAMYQLSQALSSGTVKLMDWNSVVNAGMGGQVFQDSLKETARLHGVKIDQMIKDEGSFRNTLQAGWLSSSILTETLSKFTGDLNAEELKGLGYGEKQVEEILKLGKVANDAATKVKTLTQLFDTLKEAAQSGWAKSWQIVVGDFEEAKVLWTEVSNVFGGIIGASADARNALLKGWKDLGGRASLIESISNAFNALLIVMKPINEALKEIFPPMTAEQLFALTEGFKNFTKNLKMGETTVANIKRTFKGLFALVDIGVMGISALAKGVSKLIKYLLPAGDGILGFTGGIGDFILYVRDALKASDAFNKIIEKIGEVLTPVGAILKNFGQKIKSAFAVFNNVDTTAFDAFIEKMKFSFKPFESFGNLVNTIIGGIGMALVKVLPFFSKLGTSIAEVFGVLSSKVSGAMKNLKFDGLMDLLNGGIFAAVLLTLKKLIDGMSSIASGGKGFLSSITGILDGVKGSLGAWQASLKAGMLIKIAIALALISASVIGLSMVDPTKLAGALAGISVLFVELFGSMAAFEKIAGSAGFKSMKKVTKAMISLAIAVLILSVAVTKLAALDTEGLARGLLGIAAVSAILVVSAKELEKSQTQLIKGAGGLILFATAILILSKAVESLSKINASSMMKALIGIGVLCGELWLFMKFADFDGIGVKTGVGLILFAVAINILAEAVKKFGELSVKQIIKGLGTMGLLLAGITLFAFAMNKVGGQIIAASFALNLIGSAMMLLAGAIFILGSMSMDTLSKGLWAIGSALLAIVITMRILPDDMLKNSFALVAIADALVILAIALKIMGSMSLQEMGTSLIMLSGSLLVIGLAIESLKGALSGAGALFVIANSLVILAIALKILGSMSLIEIAKSLGTMIAVLVILAVSASAMAPAIPVILALAGAIALFGVACLAIGVGVLAFSAGLAALAISGAAGAAALVVIVTSLLSLIPLALTKIGEGIIAFVTVIGDGSASIVNAVVKIALALINAIKKLTVPLISAVMNFLVTAAQKLSEAVPLMFNSGLRLILGILQGIGSNMQALVTAGANIIVQFLNGVALNLPLIVDAAFKVIISFINGLAEAIRNNGQALTDAIVNLFDAIVDAIVGLLPSIIKIGGNIVDSIITGLKNMIGTLWDEGVKIGKNVIDGIINGIKNMGGDLVKGAQGAMNKMVKGVKDFLGIKSPSRVGMSIGEYFDRGIIKGIDSLSGGISDSSINAGEGAVDSMKKALSQISGAINGEDGTFTPVITPVLDLSEVEAKEKKLKTMFNKTPDLKMTATAANAASIANSMSPDNRQLGSFSLQGVLDEVKGAVRNELAVASMNLDGTLTVQVQNDRGEIIGIAQTAVKDLLRKESR